MKSEVRRVADAAWEIVLDRRSNRVEKLEGLKLIAACKGVLLPDIDERWLSVRQVTQLRRAKQELLEKVLRKKETRRKANRRASLRRKIKVLEQETDGQATAN